MGGSIEVASTKEVISVESQTLDEYDSQTNSDGLGAEEAQTHAVLKSTASDAHDMHRMGKEQQFVRHFRLLSVASFAAVATSAWEICPFLITPALMNGGSPALLYSCLWCFVFFAPIYASLAEMASMAPIAGAQYHWVSEFAPENSQRILSYMTGWFSTMAYQAGNILGCFLVGSLVQVAISIANPDYPAPAWHATLLVFAAILIAFIGSVYGNEYLSKWQTVVFIIHCLAYFAFIVPIWVNAEKATHEQVWLDFEYAAGGWSNLPLAIMVGQLTGISGQTGVDTSTHMSEDTKDASRSVPTAMIAIYIINFVLVFPAMITLCYHIPDLDAALNDSSTYPAIWVLRNSMSTGPLIGLLVVMILLLIAGNIAWLAAVTRDLFAFARDKGFPFSNWVSRIDKRFHAPRNATIVSCGFAVALSLIYLGSPVAFYAITSLNTVALLSCYMLSIACCLWRRITHPETMPPAAISLGKWGVPTNIAALVFSVWSLFWCFWPTTSPVTAPGFNWSVAIYVLTMVVALVYFVFTARHHYFGPVMAIAARKASAVAGA